MSGLRFTDSTSMTECVSISTLGDVSLVFQKFSHKLRRRFTDAGW